MKPSHVALSILCGSVAAHFELLYPKSIGFSDDDEGKAPCGGFTSDFSKDVVDFHVGGEALAMRLLHQQGNWLFRATTNEKANGDWERLFPIVTQKGLGDFCQPRVTVPESYAGKKGVVSVVSSAPDGLLYQCIAANFVRGTAETPSECKNSSSVKATFTDDAKLSALAGGAATSASASSSSSSSTSAPSASASATHTGAASGLKAMAGTHWSSAVGLVSVLFLGAAYAY